MPRLKQYLAKSENPLGYTLIELLLVMTIIALLFLTGIASYREFSRRQELVSAVRKVQGDIRQAQELAIASKKPAGCSVLDGYYFVVVPSGSYEIRWVCGASTGVEKTIPMPAGITISGLSPNLTPSNSILFKTLGQGTNIPSAAGSTSITLTQTVYGKTAVITVTAAGEIR
jgi:prepilin-type N-terminal cleavage/methylation domain-containing protein